ncbi:exodeoxyribonuclease III [Candidatus Falkowbacteria bacterium HGW-Falkowbacteria-2]|uniref:Exodeoxyribonuclease III n=1 Tax=Candidatus Falkowbacteria bacterium HGW-Falkowbacteria-2 TaxID=2013769 RepID=A0A2N2E0K4_9BACT|nr:MAG: exodeoxyribonuclease III [Candidatus Falkowbacteria bacterium HGW-Falkowbacteria-2]
MKIISWNVNGIRAAINKDFESFLTTEKPDIICLQEIKIGDVAREKANLSFSGYQAFWHGAKRPGYSGTAVLIKADLDNISVRNGIGEDKYDDEGRVQTIEHPDFYLINIYFPNSNDILSRLPYKLEFNEAVLKLAKELEKTKPVIITGDFNVAHEEIDIARPKANAGSAGFTLEERAWFSKLMDNGFIDTFRSFFPDKVQYSWWSFRGGARFRNVGWRIDYFVISAKLRKKIKKAYILDQVLGSDHAPIGIELE